MPKHANTQTRTRISKDVREYFRKIGKKGGEGGKGSPARRRAALKAAYTRWGKHAELIELEQYCRLASSDPPKFIPPLSTRKKHA